MANFASLVAGDLCADNPFFIFTVETGLVHRVVISIPNPKLAQHNKHGILKLDIPDINSFQLAKSLGFSLSIE